MKHAVIQPNFTDRSVEDAVTQLNSTYMSAEHAVIQPNSTLTQSLRKKKTKCRPLYLRLISWA